MSRPTWSRPRSRCGSQGRLDLIDGNRLEVEHDSANALAAYDRAAVALGSTDVAPTIAAATLLGRLAAQADKDQKPDQAVAYRTQADSKLSTIAAAAEQDPDLSIILGTAYLTADAPAQAEHWLRNAIAKRPNEVEARFQLADALRRQGKQDESITTLQAAFEIDPTRADLGVELARGFEAAHRDSDAAALYKQLLISRLGPVAFLRASATLPPPADSATRCSRSVPTIPPGRF
jgi:tetratricopeptide (TPR) repeat protein